MAADIPSIAVLPLENFSRNPEQEYFADGMADQLITNLAQTGALRVISRTSAMHYKGTKKSLFDIARELQVDKVVEGAATLTGSRVRITVQLIDARNDRHLWAESYERDLRDVVSLQNELALAIAAQIRQELAVRTAPVSRLRSDTTAAYFPIRPASTRYNDRRSCSCFGLRTPSQLERLL